MVPSSEGSGDSRIADQLELLESNPRHTSSLHQEEQHRNSDQPVAAGGESSNKVGLKETGLVRPPSEERYAWELKDNIRVMNRSRKTTLRTTRAAAGRATLQAVQSVLIKL